MDSTHQLQHNDAHTGRVDVVEPSSSVLSQPRRHLLLAAPSITGSDTEPHTLLSNTRASGSFYTVNTSPPYSPALQTLKLINSHTGHTDGVTGHSGSRLSQPKRHLWYSVISSESEVYAWSSNTRVGTPQHEGSMRATPFSTNSSPLSFYAANTSVSYSSARQATTPATTVSSRMSSTYSVTSINSYKSRKNVLYPRRPQPVLVTVPPVTSEYVVSPEVTRLVPAGMMLLRSLGLQENIAHRVSVQTNEEFRYCSEFFIVLTREVLLKDAVGTRDLKGPCKLLLEAFRDILFKSKGFFSLTTSNLNVMGLQALAVVVGLIRFTCVLRALCYVMDAFEGALNVIEPPDVGDRDSRGHGREVLQKISISTGLTMDQYRKVLSQKLTQTQAQLNSFPQQIEGLLPPPIPIIRPQRGTQQTISTIDESLEAEDDGTPVNSHARMLSEKEMRSVPGKFLRRFLPSFRKEGQDGP
ncbi:hypothetical protein EDB92DRAFT_1876140 [Lactarius akahatsu]|uniref:Uncharacterized protein n=1 Tax=Lactarius akahatsu TaxID=416441 RepID=A0AAD4Q628_9AGAM|nr:hypothetical protein EDB92DRAFT_1876140 [Lactarius akahatsu]